MAEGEEKLEEMPVNERRRPERLVSRSLRQGFGFVLGFFSAIIVVLLVVSILLYVGVLLGLISWDDLLLL